VLDLLADLDGLADDLVANAAWVAVKRLAMALADCVRLHVLSRTPAAGQHVEIRLSDERSASSPVYRSITYTADTAVGDLSVDIGLLPRLGLFRASAIDRICKRCPNLYLEFTPLHVTLNRAGIMAQPAEELVILSRHICACD